MLVLSGCGMMRGSSATPATSIPTFTPASPITPGSNAAQTTALGGKQSGDLFVWVFSEPNPPIRGSNTFEAFITDASGQPVTDAKISFDIDMTNMSHGKNVVEAKSMGEGHYSSKVSFLMPGTWRVIVAVDRAGQASTVRFDFDVNFK
jgi:hypothetical protein